MKFSEQAQLAERLRRFILTCPGLPVKGGAFSLDGLNAEGASMGIHFHPGQVIRAYSDGGKVIRQPFALSYRSASTASNESKSAMIGAINAVGLWLDKIPKGDISRGLGVNAKRLQQATMAHVVEQEKDTLVYLGDFVLEYTQRTRMAA